MKNKYLIALNRQIYGVCCIVSEQPYKNSRKRKIVQIVVQSVNQAKLTET